MSFLANKQSVSKMCQKCVKTQNRYEVEFSLGFLAMKKIEREKKCLLVN